MKNGNNQFRFPMTQQDAARVLQPYMWDCEKLEIKEKDENKPN